MECGFDLELMLQSRPSNFVQKCCQVPAKRYWNYHACAICDQNKWIAWYVEDTVHAGMVRNKTHQTEWELLTRPWMSNQGTEHACLGWNTANAEGRPSVQLSSWIIWKWLLKSGKEAECEQGLSSPPHSEAQTHVASRNPWPLARSVGTSLESLHRRSWEGDEFQQGKAPSPTIGGLIDVEF